VWRGGLEAALTDLLSEVELLHDGLRMVRERLEGSTRLDEAMAPLLNEMRAVARRLQMAGDGLRAALAPPADGVTAVRWIEVRGRERTVAATSVPLDLAPILREDLFKRLSTVVVTSATLAAEQRFEFLASRLGLDEPELEPVTGIFASPFDFRRQAILAVPTDLPAPNADAAGHFLRLVRIALDLAEVSDGGIFVLFTSHRDVRACASELRARGIDRRWPLLVHGEDMRDSLLRRFRDAGRAVLLGTASFWEGVDVPGDALRGLLIAKLPFKVPTEPLTAAQCEAIEARGGDAFRDYMLPHASLRLKQGFGRLIRTASDRGVIVLTDPRVVSKSYGRTILAGLPPARRMKGAWTSILEELRKFYADGRCAGIAP
jgi:ATP-dependent DNA helicase DinG